MQQLTNGIKKHSNKTIFCLVQFKGVSLNSLPRMYFATPFEIMNRLKSTAAGRGDSIRYEHHRWTCRAQVAVVLMKKTICQ